MICLVFAGALLAIGRGFIRQIEFGLFSLPCACAPGNSQRDEERLARILVTSAFFDPVPEATAGRRAGGKHPIDPPVYEIPSIPRPP